MVAQWPQRWSAMANSPLVSSHRPSWSATLITSSFRRVEHSRKLACRRPLIRSPWGVNPGGCVLGVRTFAQVNARSPTRARFLAGPLVSGSLLSRGTRLDQADSWPTTSDRIGVWTIPAPDDGACAVRKSHVARPSSKPILTSGHLFDTLEHDRTSTPRPT